MKQRWVLQQILQGSDIAADEVYGTWTTYAAAERQAKIWERKAAKIWGDDTAVSFVPKRLHMKTKSSALAALWEWLRRNNS
jgi:hypothetical protein